MKKILTLSLALVLLSAAASAQKGPGDRIRRHSLTQGFNDGRLTKPERFELRKDAFRYQKLNRKVRRDGVVTPLEHRRLRNARLHERREMFRFRHNGRRRVI